MEVVLQTKGLPSLPANPRTRVSNLPQGLRHRLNTRTNRDLVGFSLSVDGFQRYIGSVSKNHVFGKNSRNFHICRAEAAAMAVEDGQPVRDTKDVLVVTAKRSTIDGCIAFGDDADFLKGACGKSLASFPQAIPSIAAPMQSDRMLETPGLVQNHIEEGLMRGFGAQDVQVILADARERRLEPVSGKNPHEFVEDIIEFSVAEMVEKIIAPTLEAAITRDQDMILQEEGIE
ncbi:hypothetical protein NE237_031487 [Protea cynaroides]|uniref:Uncharacterized protein n=1 Tax=Protea cynaroides TaxID=273540 RepID=A0A9Q0R260_9MAGN|nr:hypothetical protein NE237_031487 [Protea cynaroides]